MPNHLRGGGASLALLGFICFSKKASQVCCCGMWMECAGEATLGAELNLARAVNGVGDGVCFHQISIHAVTERPTVLSLSGIFFVDGCLHLD